MTDDVALEYYRRAGAIAAKVRNEAVSLVREGMKVIDLCERVEGMIEKEGAKPGFPCNVSINELAAHYTSPPGDETIIPQKAIVKLDFGVHVDGYIADNAVSIFFNPEYEVMAKASREAVRMATKSVKAGVRPSEIGSVIQRTITSFGYKPVNNLTGHRIDRFVIHAGNVIPNVPDIDGDRLAAGEIYAIEPFVTYRDAAASVKNGKEGNIYRLVREKGAKSKEARDLIAHIKEEFKTIPFTTRWLVDFDSDFRRPFEELLKARCVYAYPVLVEASGRPVAQHEHTVLVKEDGCEVITE